MLKKQSIESITIGFPADGDRYSQSVCERDLQAIELASRLERFPFHNPNDWVKGLFRECVLALYKNMEREVHIIVCEHEPYLTSEAMQADVRDNHQMLVRKRIVGPVAGHLVQHWRAVHDYYGHVQMHAPFTMRGELSAFARHAVQFPRVCLPFIWNNVVLENVYRLNRGHFLCLNTQCSSKIVFDTEFFGPEDKFYKTAIMEV